MIGVYTKVTEVTRVRVPAAIRVVHRPVEGESPVQVRPAEYERVLLLKCHECFGVVVESDRLEHDRWHYDLKGYP